MPSSKKIDYEKVFASLNTTCPKCGRVIEPQEIRRVSWKYRICYYLGNGVRITIDLQ
jgi:hypothetical protein